MKSVPAQAFPSLFHVTHWKAGSQWIHRILLDLAPERIVAPQVGEGQFLNNPVVRGGVYPTVYVTREQFYSVALPDGYAKFVVIRDLRDTLVSAYFSIRHSHAVIDPKLAQWRRDLNSMPEESGLLMLLDEWLPMAANIQRSWLTAGEDLVRYEDLLKNDVELLERVLLTQCRIPVTRERLRQVVQDNRFEKVTGGRKLGEEDVGAHERRGAAGDWRNHFTAQVSREFNKRFGDLLALSGYEEH